MRESKEERGGYVKRGAGGGREGDTHTSGFPSDLLMIVAS